MVEVLAVLDGSPRHHLSRCSIPASKVLPGVHHPVEDVDDVLVRHPVDLRPNRKSCIRNHGVRVLDNCIVAIARDAHLIHHGGNWPLLARGRLHRVLTVKEGAELLAPPPRPILDVDFLGDLDGIVNLDAKVADGAFDLRVAEQQLDGPKVAGTSVDQCRLGSPQRVRTGAGRIRPILAIHSPTKRAYCRVVRPLSPPRRPANRNCPARLPAIRRCSSIADALLGQLEPYRAPGFLLANRRTVDGIAIGCHVVTRTATTSQPRNLLSMARLKRARSRDRRSNWSRVRIDQTCPCRSGGLAPINLPLFQGGRRGGLPVAVVSLSFMVSLHGWKWYAGCSDHDLTR